MAITPRFNATIDADISKFMKKAATVDKTIKSMASGVIVDIGANISNFMQRAATVQATAANIANNSATVNIDANTSGFNAQAAGVQAAIAEINSSDPTVSVDANTAGFMAQMAAVQATTAAVAGATPTVTVNANTAVAAAQVTGFMATMQAVTGQNLIVRLRASWANYQAVMGAMASFSRNFSEIVGMTARGITIAISPAIVPVLASVVGLLGNLGPMLGTIAGSTFALGSAFGTAGIGAAAFGAVAVHNLKDIFAASEELKKLDEKLAKAEGWKERQKIMKEIKAVQGSLNAEQAKGLDAMNKLKATWGGIAGALETQTIQIFTKALGILSGVLTTLKPMFTTVMDAANGLMDSLGRAIDSAPMQAFFDYLNTSAAPIMTTITEAVGYFMQGFLNMMTAFGPLAAETASGFRNMGKGFAEWSAGLSKSDKFQAFVSYVSENMPKIRSIFSDAIQGMINMFAGFSGSSSDMMTSLQNMMERFKNFSATISENQGFQNFIDYIKTNGPVVVSAIGEIITLITNLGIAAAPMGEKMLGMIDGMTNFANGMLKAHPWLGKLAVGAIVLTGAFLAVLPTLVGLNALLGGFITQMILATARTIWAATVQVAQWILIGTTATLNAIKVAAAWTLANGPAMIASVARTIASAVIIVAQWVLMGVQSGLQAIRVAAAWTLSAGAAMASAVASTVVAVTRVIGQWLLMGAQALIHGAKVAAAWLLTTGAAMVTAVASMVATAAVFVAKWVWMGVQALAQAARMAAAWFIALGPVGWVAGAIIGLAVLIIANWDKIAAWTKKTWTTVSDWIKTKWQEISAKTSEAASKMLSTVITKFAEIVSNIRSKMDSAKTTIQQKWEEAKTAAVTKISAMLTAVIQKFAEIVNNVRNKMNDAKTTISTKWEEAKSATISKIASIVTAVISKFAEIVNNVRNKMTEAKTALSNKWDEAKSATSSKLSALVSTAINFFSNLVSAVRTKMSEAVSVLGQKVGEMPGKVRSYAGAMLSAGADLVRGLINGIKNMAGAAVEAISGVVSGVVNKAKSLLKIKSPSRVFREIGEFTGSGLAKGVSSTESANAKAIAGVTKVLTSIAKTHADEITKITKEATKEQASIKQAAAKKEHSIQAEANTAIQRIVANAHAKKRNLTIAETNKIHDIRKTAATKINDLETTSAKEVAAIHSKASAEKLKKDSELSRLRLDGIKQFVSDKKSLEDMTLVAEANVWRRSMELFKAGSKERVEAQKNYRDSLQTINNEVVSASENFASKQKDINSRLIADEQALTKAYVDAVSSRADAIKSFASLFEEIKQPEDMVSGEKLLDNLSGQIQSMQKWQKEMRELAAKGIDQGLLEELRQMGPKAINELEALNSLTGDKLTTYSNLFKEKTSIARREAEAELVGMKKDTSVQIDALRKVANTELGKLKADFLKTIDSITQGTSTKFKTLTQIGKDAIAGLQKGMADMSPALMATARNLANAVSAEIAKALKIKSPSRVFMEMGGFVTEGLAIGIDSKAKQAVDSVTNVANAMTNAFSPDLAFQSIGVEMDRMDYGSELDALSAQVKRELSVDMSVNHKGSTGGGETSSTKGLFDGANFYVRSDDDIDKLAKQLERHRQQGKRKVRA